MLVWTSFLTFLSRSRQTDAWANTGDCFLLVGGGPTNMICDITNSLAAYPGPVFSVHICDLKNVRGRQTRSVLQVNRFIDRVRVSCLSCVRPDVQGRGLLLPDIVVFLNVDLVKHHVLLLGIYVRLHLHGNMARKHWEQKTFLQGSKRESSFSEPASCVTIQQGGRRNTTAHLQGSKSVKLYWHRLLFSWD